MSRISTGRAFAAAVTASVSLALLLATAHAAWPGRPGGGGDDTYQFADGFGQQVAVTVTATPAGVQLTFPSSPPSPTSRTPGKPWDTALLGVRVTAQAGNPYIDLAVGPIRVRQHVDPGAHGLRWLNLTGLRSQLTPGTVLELRPQAAHIDVGPATVRLFASQPPLDGRILVLSPHPDDAEIAAFGLYAHALRPARPLRCAPGEHPRRDWSARCGFSAFFTERPHARQAHAVHRRHLRERGAFGGAAGAHRAPVGT
jgi:hypothetical protein